MSQNITQTLGIDASQALKTLAELDRGYASFEARVRSLANALQQSNGSTAQQVKKLGAAFQSNIPQAVQQTERLTTSLGLLSRIAFTQVVVAGLGKVKRALQSTATDAAEFQKQVALITTIGDGAKFGEIADQVRRLSDSFNIPLLQAAEGVYNALSNQVGNFGESVRFSEEAARFAKATNSSLKDSVDLLSAALKGYGLGVEDTDKVLSIFFATIDKGRINASQLANSFGRVDTIAADLGVSLEETGGALAAISVRGTKTSEALTQFRAILSALQKPSKAMAKTLNELGFTSAEVAIKTLGLTGVLSELSKTTGGSGEALAKLFPNIRGLSGVASLTSDDLKTLADNINEMTTAGREFNREKFLQATATDAERVTEEINKLKNEMTVGLGQAVLKTTKDLFSLTNGAEGLIKASHTAVPAIAGVGGAMLALKGSTALANAELGLLSKGLGAVAVLAVGAGIGTALGNFASDKLTENLFKNLRKLEEADRAALESFEAGLKEQRDAYNSTNAARVQAALAVNRELNRAYLTDVQNAKTAEQKKAAFAKFESATPVNEKLLGVVLNRKISSPDDASRAIIDAQKRAAELKAKIDTALTGERGVNDLRGNIDELFKEIDQRSASRNLIGGDNGEALRKQFASVREQLGELRTDSDITAVELAKVIDARNKLGQLVTSGKGVLGSGFADIESAAFATTLNGLDSILSKLQEIQRLQPADVTGLQTELSALDLVLRDIAPIDQKFQSAAIAIGSGVLPAQAIAAAMASAASSAERAAAAASRISAPVNRATGGSVGHFADGGSPRGTDTINAMLSPGEYVINAQSSRRFFSQIQAINAGKTPNFKAAGGNVTNQNTSVGDMHFHNVKGGPDAAREVMKAIRREQRRGSGRI